jgi:hypothetical protein
MLGYSDLLINPPLTDEQKPMAAKIGQYVRRTKSLVASLISFARQAPAPKAPLDLNTLARTAVKLTEPHWKALELDVRTRFDGALPKVLGIPISCCRSVFNLSATACTFWASAAAVSLPSVQSGTPASAYFRFPLRLCRRPAQNSRPFVHPLTRKMLWG